MLQYLLLRWKLWRLDRKWAASVRRTFKAVEAARAKNTSEGELKEIAGGRDDYLWRQRINALQTAYLQAQADRLIVEVPDFYDATMWVHDGDRHFLTPAGFAQLRAAIRTEKKARAEETKARAELFAMWMPGIVGILGALIGLASILIGKGK
jgi:hypothetical protein